MRYWWVNHKQTSKLEIAGGFLWSPMRKANGARNQFYENMRLASPADMVISFANAQIRHVGIVTDFAIPAPKPPAFGNAGRNWDKNNGWFLPIAWHALAKALTPKQRIREFSEILPKKYSPIHPITGDGRQNAYLAEVGKSVYDLLIGRISLESNSTSQYSSHPPESLKCIDDALELDILGDANLDTTTKAQVIAARRGQGVFKGRVSEFENCCRLTQIKTPGFLIASHIKPWRLCSVAAERLDGANGLLLTPNADLLFDRGYITFKDNGALVVSSRLTELDRNLFAVGGCLSNKVLKAFHERQRAYMAFHRDQVFLG